MTLTDTRTLLGAFILGAVATAWYFAGIFFISLTTGADGGYVAIDGYVIGFVIGLLAMHSMDVANEWWEKND